MEQNDAVIYSICGVLMLLAPLFATGMVLDQDEYWIKLDTFVIVFGPISGVVIAVLWQKAKKTIKV